VRSQCTLASSANGRLWMDWMGAGERPSAFLVAKGLIRSMPERTKHPHVNRSMLEHRADNEAAPW
jgi:hypothetical protein